MQLPKLPAFVRTNAFVYAVCLLGAFFLWHYIHANNNHREVFPDIPLAFSFGAFTNGMVTASSVQKVTVTVAGALEDVTALSANDIKANLLLDNHPTNKTYSLSSANISLPGKPHFSIEVEPRECRVETDARVSKSVDVELDRLNNLPDGFHLDIRRITPISVMISGPAAQLAQRRIVYTAPLELSTLTRNLVNHRIGLASVPNCVLDPDVVTLDLDVKAIETEVDLPPAQISVLGPLGRPMRFQVSPPTAVVRVKGTSDALKRAENDDWIVFADARDFTASSSRERPLRAIPHADVTVVGISPPFVTVSAQDPDEF